MRKFLLDTNCFIDAARDSTFRARFAQFCESAAPGLYLSAVVAAELRAGAQDVASREHLESEVLAGYVRRGRILTPSARSWEALGHILSVLGANTGLRADQTPRSFVFDILVAQTCREHGVTLISGNRRDMQRIATVTPFDFTAPFPDLT